MSPFVGLFIVLGSVVSGYLMEKGNIFVLFQPAEILIIFGSATGALLIGSGGKTIVFIMKNMAMIFNREKISLETYLELLLLLYQLFLKTKNQGLLSIESDIEKPLESPIFSKFKSILKNRYALDFICDNFRVIIATNMTPNELDALLDVDIEAHHHEGLIPSSSIAKVADSLPGLGIVAAVLGVVLTMGKIGEPPEILGHSIGAALVGTFIGVLSCYGFVGPIATRLEFNAKEREVYLNVIKTALIAFVSGSPPRIAVESGRRAIPSQERPTFEQLEEEIKKWKEKV